MAKFRYAALPVIVALVNFIFLLQISLAEVEAVDGSSSCWALSQASNAPCQPGNVNVNDPQICDENCRVNEDAICGACGSSGCMCCHSSSVEDEMPCLILPPAMIPLDFEGAPSPSPSPSPSPTDPPEEEDEDDEDSDSQ